MTRKFFIWILAAQLIVGLAGFIFYFLRGKPFLKTKVAQSLRISNHTDNVLQIVENHDMDNETKSSFSISDIGNPLSEEYDEEEREVIQNAKMEALKAIEKIEKRMAESYPEQLAEFDRKRIETAKEQVKYWEAKGYEAHETVEELAERWKAEEMVEIEVLKLKEAFRRTIEIIDDKELLLKIVKIDTNKLMRLHAVFKLGDQAFYTEFAKNTREEYEERRLVIQFIKDQTIIADIAIHDTDWRMRETLVEKINDKALLERMANNDSHFNVRRSAWLQLKKISEKELGGSGNDP